MFCYGQIMAKSLILSCPNSNPNPNNIRFCRNNGAMENMDKGLIVPIWVLINRPKIPQTPKNLSAQIVYPGPKFWNFDEKRLHWASIVCILQHVAKEKKLRKPLEK